jgi:hypothetical protein
MSSKTIKVNPIFLSGSGTNAGFSVKNKTRKEKPTGVSLGQSNSIKKKLIARIKNFQQKSGEKTQALGEEEKPDAFSDSLQFLDNLARDKEETKKEKKNTGLKNTTLKKKQQPMPNAYMNIATELPPELDWNTIMPQLIQTIPQVQAPASMAAPPTVPMQAPASVPTQTTSPTWTAAPQPSYGNLKKGTKPTYRTWLRTTQKQKPAVKQTINILEDIQAPTIEVPTEVAAQTHSIALGAATADLSTPVMPMAEAEPMAEPVAVAEPPAKPYTPSLKPRRKRITRTLKYKLGKHANGTVSVLIKNSQTRRKVQTEQALLKQKSILDIKNHLRSNNLLKVGSNAPSDVLRQLYEQSILAGQIENKAKDTLIHNYFNEEK